MDRLRKPFRKSSRRRRQSKAKSIASENAGDEDAELESMISAADETSSMGSSVNSFERSADDFFEVMTQMSIQRDALTRAHRYIRLRREVLEVKR